MPTTVPSMLWGESRFGDTDVARQPPLPPAHSATTVPHREGDEGPSEGEKLLIFGRFPPTAGADPSCELLKFLGPLFV